MSYDDYKTNKDPVLETILNYNGEKWFYFRSDEASYSAFYSWATTNK